MGGYVQWLARRYEEMRARFAEKVAEYRARAMTNAGTRADAGDRRESAGWVRAVPGVLQWKLARQIAPNETDLASGCWDALSCAAAAQAKHQAATEPAARFLTLLRSLLSSGRAHLESRNGGEPDRSPESCGWKRDNSSSWMSAWRLHWVDR